MMITAMELGYDFRRIKTATVLSKSRIGSFLGFVFLVCFLPIFLVFLVLYTLGVTIDINEIPRVPADPEYQQFFLIFFLSMGIPSLISLFFALAGNFAKPTPYAYLALDENGNRTLYVTLKNRHIYLDGERMITLDKRRGTVGITRDQQEIRNGFRDYLFFLALDDISGAKIRRVGSILTISYKLLTGRTTERRQYRIRFDESGEPRLIREMISAMAYGNSSLRSLRTLYLDSINKNQRLPYDPLIRRELSRF